MRVAVVLPGSGSSSDFVRRAFGGPLAAAGYGLVVPEPAPGSAAVAGARAALDEAVAQHDVRLVGGVSLGAHVAAGWLASRQPAARRAHQVAGALLALPAWTGPPGAVAAASAQAAEEVLRYGTDGALRRAGQAGAARWVAEELRRAWPSYGPELVATLRATAASRGPEPAELRRVGMPVGLVAFTDDPLHPAAVAQEWAASLPCAAVEYLRLADMEASRDALGAAALRAWRRAARGPGVGIWLVE